MCDQYKLDDIQEMADAIIERSEAAVRDSIRRLPAGSWETDYEFDIPNGDIVHLHLKVTVDNKNGDLYLDYAGSSPESTKGVNVTLSYTRGYAMFGVRCVLNPEIPNNAGSMTPIHVTGPEGSIVNCRYPAPVAGRHHVGMLLPMPIMKVFYDICPEKVIAPSAGSSYSCRVFGEFDNGERYVAGMSGITPGMGARATKRGLDATYYPAGLGTVPCEIVESESKVVFNRRELRYGSGGKGKNNGGDGQIVEFYVNSVKPWLLKSNPSSRNLAPEGLGGAESGKPGVFRIDGKEIAVHGKMRMKPGSVVYMETPGGGGYGALTDR
jgi:N-methylhydantoinase B